MAHTRVQMSQQGLAGLRAKAAAARALAAAAPAAAVPLSGWLQRRRSSHPRPSSATAVADLQRPPVAAAQTGDGRIESVWRRSGRDNEDGQIRLQRAVRQLLDSGRPGVAAHLVQQEWAETARPLDDAALSKELIVQLAQRVSAVAALEALPTVTSSADMCAAAVRALAKRNSLRGVRAVMQHARETRVADHGAASRDLWRAAIVAYGQLRRPAEARQAFVDMRAAGAWSVADTVTVNLLLNAIHTDIKLQYIRWNQLRQEGVQPDTSTINCLLKACMRARDVRRADMALVWMRDAGVRADEITWNTLIKVFSYSGEFERVLDVWRSMGAARFPPTPKLWGSLLMACSAAGQLEHAAIVWWEMKQLHSEGGGGMLTTDSVCAMMTACNDAGQYERALTAFEEAKALSIPMDVRAHNIALRACHTPGKTLRQEQLMQAFAIYDDMKRVGLTPDAFTFGTLFSLCAAARQGHCALQLYAEMRQLGVQENVVAMTALAKAVGSTPGPGMAQECVRIFRRMVYGPARLKPNQATYRTVIAVLREQGELAEALRVYEGMRKVYPADNSEFEGLTAVAAERALACEDAELRSAVAAVCGITPAACGEEGVDLHGMSVLEARAAVLCVLAVLQQQFRDTGLVAHDVTLITGRGLGSYGGEPVVRREVARMLSGLGITLPAPASGDNPGRIVIPRMVLAQALQRKMASRQQQPKPRHSGNDGSSSSPSDADGSANS